MPTADEIAKFNAAAYRYATESGKTVEDAKRDLGNLLANMVKDPIGTDIYILGNRIAALEKAAGVVDELAGLKTRVAKLEDQLRKTQLL